MSKDIAVTNEGHVATIEIQRPPLNYFDSSSGLLLTRSILSMRSVVADLQQLGQKAARRRSIGDVAMIGEGALGWAIRALRTTSSGATTALSVRRQ
jgi:hypothetical protein